MARKTLPTSEMTGESDNFEAIYESHVSSIYRFMFWRTKDQTLAEDLTSNVFEKAWRTRQSFTGGSAKAWLFRIARTTLIDHWRKNQEIPDDGSTISELTSDDAGLGENLDKEQAIVRLRKSVARLPEEMRHVVELRFIEGLSVREVSRRLGITEANVRVIQYRALQKLRKYLQ